MGISHYRWAICIWESNSACSPKTNSLTIYTKPHTHTASSTIIKIIIMTTDSASVLSLGGDHKCPQVRSDLTPGDDSKRCPDSSSHFINFRNTHGLHSNFHSLKYPLYYSISRLLLKQTYTLERHTTL